MRFVWTPLTTGSISSPVAPGSDSIPVRGHFFGRDVYLADSMQFLLEAALRLHRSGVFYISCSLRGERPDARHLAEFMHSEVEIAGDLEAVVLLAEEYVRHLAQRALAEVADAVEALCGTTDHLRSLSAAGAFPRIRFTDAVQTLSQFPDAIRTPFPGAFALTAEGEKLLLNEIRGPLWVTHFPAVTSPFYQRISSDGIHSLSADLLMGDGEILGCGERCTTRDEVEQSLVRQRVDPRPYDWYLQLKELTPLSSAGFGLGVERLVRWMSQAEDIRDCTLWLRDHEQPLDP